MTRARSQTPTEQHGCGWDSEPEGTLAVARSIYRHLPAGLAPFWRGTGHADITHVSPGIVIRDHLAANRRTRPPRALGSLISRMQINHSRAALTDTATCQDQRQNGGYRSSSDIRS